MYQILGAILVRIFSNPFANLLQKIAAKNNSSILVNLYSYLFLSLMCCYSGINNNWGGYNSTFWELAILAGILCTLSSVCLIKALEMGEMSVLGPINSYKCVIGLIIGAIFLNEIPNIVELLGVVIIIFGSIFIFDTVRKNSSLPLYKRKDIILRFLALLFSACEAVILKKIILYSSVYECFMLWCFLGFICSILLMILLKVKVKIFSIKDMFLCFGIAICLGLMQLSTNFVFEKMDVGLSLALFQLSGIVTVFLGHKFFNEVNILKKVVGSIIMVIGSCLILIK